MMKAETILHLEANASYADMIENKEWLTSSEAKSYIKKHLLFLKRVITFGKSGYRTLYEACDSEVLDIACVRTSTLGGQLARFYNKASLKREDSILAIMHGYDRRDAYDDEDDVPEQLRGKEPYV